MPLWPSAHNFVTSQKRKKKRRKKSKQTKRETAMTIGAISHVNHYFKSNNEIKMHTHSSVQVSKFNLQCS